MTATTNKHKTRNTTTPGKAGTLLGILSVPIGAEYAIVHGIDARGALGPKLSLEQDGRIFDVWPIKEMTREWLCATFGPGTYRLQFLGITPDGRRKKLGTSGAFLIEDTAPAVVEVEAPAAATDAPAMQTFQPPASMAEQWSALNMYRTIESEVRSRERADYEARTERDRLFFGALMQMVGTGRPAPDVRAALVAAQTPAGEVAEEEEEEDGVEAGIKSFVREVSPVLREMFGDYMRAKMGGGGTPA